MEKKKIGGNIIGIIIITIIAGLYAFVHRGYLFNSTPQDLYDMLAEEGEPVKDKYVTVQVDASLGCYAETEHKINGIIPMGTDGHYLVWLDNDGIISLTVKGKDNFKILDDITNDTYDAVISGTYIFPEPVEFTGKIETMNSELNGFYRDALNYYGIGAGYTVYNVNIDASTGRLGLWLMFGFILLIDAIAIIALVKDIKHNAAIDASPAAAYKAETAQASAETSAEENNTPEE